MAEYKKMDELDSDMQNLMIAGQLALENVLRHLDPVDTGHLLANMLIWHTARESLDLDEDELIDKLGDLVEGMKKAIMVNRRMLQEGNKSKE